MVCRILGWWWCIIIVIDRILKSMLLLPFARFEVGVVNCSRYEISHVFYRILILLAVLSFFVSIVPKFYKKNLLKTNNETSATVYDVFIYPNHPRVPRLTELCNRQPYDNLIFNTNLFLKGTKAKLLKLWIYQSTLYSRQNFDWN